MVFLDTLMCRPDKYLPVYKYLKRTQSKEVTLVVYSDNLNCLVSTPKTISLALNYPVNVSNDCTDTWTS